MRSERSRNGGVDEVPVPAPGRLFLCGKHFVGPDVDAAIARVGADAVVCLNPARELEDRYPDYVAWLRTDERAVWYPIPDLGAPPVDVVRPFLDALRDRLVGGETLLVHCGAGIGRAGTVAGALLVLLGHTVAEATAVVAASRPMAGPEAGAQRLLLEQL